MFYRKFTFWLTLFAVVVCLINALGFDPDSLFLFFISVPAWFYEMIFDVHRIHLFWLYSSTLIFWLLLGYLIDRMVLRAKRAQQ